VRRDASKSSPLFEVASLLLPLDHVARIIVNAITASCERPAVGSSDWLGLIICPEKSSSLGKPRCLNGQRHASRID